MPDLRAPSTQRRLMGIGAACCAALIAVAMYMQHVMGLEPCPLCVFQRIFIMVAGAVMLVAALHNPAGLARRIYGALIAIAAISGAAVAARHVWLQNLPPDQVPECGPGLSYMFDAFPLMEALSMVFQGSGECAEVQWTFLGLSIPGWTLLVFLGLALFGAFVAVTRERRGSLHPASS